VADQVSHPCMTKDRIVVSVYQTEENKNLNWIGVGKFSEFKMFLIFYWTAVSFLIVLRTLNFITFSKYVLANLYCDIVLHFLTTRECILSWLRTICTSGTFYFPIQVPFSVLFYVCAERINIISIHQKKVGLCLTQLKFLLVIWR
jgi:hypothetical protein